MSLEIVFVKGTATVMAGPSRFITLVQGDHWPASDPIVKAHPGLFTADATVGLQVSAPLEVNEEENADAGQPQAPVEQATKAPGEKRTTRRG